MSTKAMSNKYNYILIDNPNGRPDGIDAPFAQLINLPLTVSDEFGKDVAQIEVQDMYLPHYSVRVSKGVFAYDALLVNTSANGIDLLGSCIFREVSVKSFVDDKIMVESYNGTQNFKYDPMNEIKHIIPANKPFNMIHFGADLNYFMQFLPENEGWSALLKNKIHNQERIMGSRSTPILLAQEHALQTIFDCPLNGKLGELMIETAITQIILLQLSAVFQQTESQQEKLTKRDIEIVQSLKQYLSTTFLETHSLETLARHFGTNTNKLMTLFKRTFKKSIFDYIGELKMEYAHSLLLDEKKMIADVAREVGYKNPHHFSTAFKRKFGINPSHLRLNHY
jgi:AraC-like DNA-binding protein